MIKLDFVRLKSNLIEIQPLSHFSHTIFVIERNLFGKRTFTRLEKKIKPHLDDPCFSIYNALDPLFLLVLGPW